MVSTALSMQIRMCRSRSTPWATAFTSVAFNDQRVHMRGSTRRQRISRWNTSDPYAVLLQRDRESDSVQAWTGVDHKVILKTTLEHKHTARKARATVDAGAKANARAASTRRSKTTKGGSSHKCDASRRESMGEVAVGAGAVLPAAARPLGSEGLGCLRRPPCRMLVRALAPEARRSVLACDRGTACGGRVCIPAWWMRERAARI